MKTINKFWIALGILILLSPLGLILPDHFKAGSAWGEWGADEIHQLVGYVPHGLRKISALWKAPIPDYAFKGWEEKGLIPLSLAYIVSGILGSLAVVLIVQLMGKLLVRKGE
jgi:hypothetical protein